MGIISCPWSSYGLSIPLLVILVSCNYYQLGLSATSSHCANPNDFPCRIDNSSCIPRIKWQDGETDCADGSDEECLEWQFDCKFGKPRCVNLHNLLDGSIDCSSGFDESCPANYFVCADRSSCIDPKRYQDGHKDCSDGSDEPCPAAHFACKDGLKCIPQDLFQDGKPDCTDGSDEECSLFQFECRCGWPACISMSKFNNTVKDCEDYSDEPESPEGSRNLAQKCSSGSEPRNRTVKALPPRAPMVPCGPAEANLAKNCNPQLGEVCMIFAGAARCVCRMGTIRAPGSPKCEPPPTRIDPLLNRTTDFLVKCDANKLCPTAQESCWNGFCKCKEKRIRHHVTGDCIEAEPIQFPVYIERVGSQPVTWSDELKDPNNPLNAKVLSSFKHGIEMVNSASRLYPYYINNDVVPVGNPSSLVNNLGLTGTPTIGAFYNVTIFMLPSCIQGQTLWTDLQKSMRNCNYSVCGTDLTVGQKQIYPFGEKSEILKPCGNTGKVCDMAAGEMCQSNGICSCSSGEQRRSDATPCLEIVGVPLSVVVIRNSKGEFSYNDTYGNHKDLLYIQLIDLFKQGVHQVFAHSALYPYYVTTQVNRISNPNAVNSSWTSGILFNVTVFVRPGTVTRQLVWDQFFKSVRITNNVIGSTGLIIADWQPEPENIIGRAVVPCGKNVCDVNLGEFCLADGTCGCIPGSVRKDQLSPCVDVIVFVLPLYVIRRGVTTLHWLEEYSNPTGDSYIELVDLCELCLHNVFRESSFNSRYVTTQVSSIVNSKLVRPDWTDGLVFNYTVYMRPDTVQTHSIIWSEITQIIRGTDNACGGTELYIGTEQPNPLVFTDWHPPQVSFDTGTSRQHDSSVQTQASTTPSSTDSTTTTDRLSVIKIVSETKVTFTQSQPTSTTSATTTESTTVSTTSSTTESTTSATTESTTTPTTTPSTTASTTESTTPTTTPTTTESTTTPTTTSSSSTTESTTTPTTSSSTPSTTSSTTPSTTESTTTPTTTSSTTETTTTPTTSSSTESTTTPSTTQSTTVTTESTTVPTTTSTESTTLSTTPSTTASTTSLTTESTTTPTTSASTPSTTASTTVSSTTESTTTPTTPTTTESTTTPSTTQSTTVTTESTTTPSTTQSTTVTTESTTVPTTSTSTGSTTVPTTSSSTAPTTQSSTESSTTASTTPTTSSSTLSATTASTTVPTQTTTLTQTVPPATASIARVTVPVVEIITVGRTETQQTSASTTASTTSSSTTTTPSTTHSTTPTTTPSTTTPTTTVSSTTTSTPKPPVVTSTATITTLILSTRGTPAQVIVPFITERVTSATILAPNTTTATVATTVSTAETTTQSAFVTAEPPEKKCLSDAQCKESLGETCTQQGVCRCPGNKARSAPDQPCIEVVGYTCPIRIISLQGIELLWRPEYANPNSFEFKELVELFKRGMIKVQTESDLNEYYVAMVVHNIIDGRSLNSSWSDGGLVFNYTVLMRPTITLTLMEFWNLIQKTIETKNDTIGDTGLVIARIQPYYYIFSEYIHYTFPIRIVMRGDQLLTWSDEYSNNRSKTALDLISAMTIGLQTTAKFTTARAYYINSLVNGFLNPTQFNGNWTSGLIVNVTIFLRRGVGLSAADLYDEMIAVILANHKTIYGTNITIAVDQLEANQWTDLSGGRSTRSTIGFNSHTIAFSKGGLHPTALPVIKLNESVSNSFAVCDIKHPLNSCPGRNEECRLLSGKLTCACQNNYTRNPLTQKCFLNVDECADPALNDCDPNAICMDNPLSFECLCKPGFLDMSSVPQTTPGRKCLPLVDECKNAKLNDCDDNAECIDLPGGFACKCRTGYTDASLDRVKFPGRRCIREYNECLRAADNDCGTNSICIDTIAGFDCQCQSGFVDVSPTGAKKGRVCRKVVNECADPSLNDCDKLNGECIDTVDSFACQCKSGMQDESPSRPGRKCKDTRVVNNPCTTRGLNDCDLNAVCTNLANGQFTCTCADGFVDVSPKKPNEPGKKCLRVQNECNLGLHDCDLNANCSDTVEGFTCTCPPGYKDTSVDPTKPGRACQPLECKPEINGCSQNATCTNTPSGAKCQCKTGYVDLSVDASRQPGRVCKQIFNECAARSTNDCSPDAVCIDTVDSFTCSCNEGFKDDSKAGQPGRVCTRILAPPTVPTCDVKDPMACDKQKVEVCRFVDGAYQCTCPPGISRLSDGRCKVTNECAEPKLNDCDKNADCLDTPESFKCQCKSGFVDVSKGKSGTECKKKVNECLDTKLSECDKNAECVDTDESYRCVCHSGFADISEEFGTLPGHKCVEAINECRDSALHNCSLNAVCEDAKVGYTCHCKEGFIDASPNVTQYPGRVCNPKPTEGLNGSAQVDSCDPNAAQSCKRKGEICRKGPNGQFSCSCPDNSQRTEDGTCKLFGACESKELNDCDRNAICSNVFDSFTCQCRPGFLDRSSNPNSKPGRRCVELKNECAAPNTNDCSPHAKCVDTPDTYFCVCNAGYLDVSYEFHKEPGRQCYNASDECSLRSLNTCDDNADCVDLPNGYTCQCATGFIDVSHSANLPPGRVCTLQTICNQLKVDLIFVVDGSGSIGSYSFNHEVLRFVNEFIDLFDIGPDKTLVGLIQYSDTIRHEFELKDHQTKSELKNAAASIQYLTGLTQTGAAIKEMSHVGFHMMGGGRNGVPKIGIVITDGRSQDNVSVPAQEALRMGVKMFAVGVTDHILESELVEITGRRDRVFIVKNYTDLNTRLRSVIQKLACNENPPTTPTTKPITGCSLNNGSCDRSLNEICKESAGLAHCECPEGFERHPITHACGGQLCNPTLPTTCPDPELCKLTPFGNHRCVCPKDFARNPNTGSCFSTLTTPTPPPPIPSSVCDINRPDSCNLKLKEVCIQVDDGSRKCGCAPGSERNARNNICGPIGSCDPKEQNPCDSRKNEKCLPDPQGQNICQCGPNSRRHTVTGVCLVDECKSGLADCDKHAKCVDTETSFICFCPPNFIDQSPDTINKPGRICAQEQNECLEGTHNCSVNAICTDTTSGFVCSCKPGFVDKSPNPQFFQGTVCEPMVNECLDPTKNDCSTHAQCVDTVESFLCICKPGFIDRSPFVRPGRSCETDSKPDIVQTTQTVVTVTNTVKVNDRCKPGNNDCDQKAKCSPRGIDDFECVCLSGFVDRSPNPVTRPGRICIPFFAECDNPNHNDCDRNAQCVQRNDGFTCRCKEGFIDISQDPLKKPGRNCKLQIDECLIGSNDCDRFGAICVDTPDSFRCRCKPGFLDVSRDTVQFPGRSCQQLRDECHDGSADCSPSAECIDTQDSYQCRCLTGFLDVSVDPFNRPGRRCVRLINECLDPGLNSCHKNAECTDTPESYRCACRSGFVDASPDIINNAGRDCRPKQFNECINPRDNDCDANAICMDKPDGFVCECRSGFVDSSPKLPGRICTRVTTPATVPTVPPECLLGISSTCRQDLNEVCRVIDGKAKCSCPESYQRNRNTNACTVVNECEFVQLNDCGREASCKDELDGYSCKCKDGFLDKSPNPLVRPGRICQKRVDECKTPGFSDCDVSERANCIDLDDGYRCECKPNHRDLSPDPKNRPGRICRLLINECENKNQNSCDPKAICTDLQDGYQCRCPDQFLDISPNPSEPGRNCIPVVNECKTGANDCDKNATCEDTVESFRCACKPGFLDVSPNLAFPGRHCKELINECTLKLHDCDRNAICRDSEDSFTCQCPSGFVDRSPNRLTRPGRVCLKLVNECVDRTHDCSRNATCRDLEVGYTCECNPGLIDRSPNQPGRVCQLPDICPPIHDCGANSVCEPRPGNQFTCICIPGFVDKSPPGKPGRICERNNACRDQRMNNCSKNALCFDLVDNYRCECQNGYVDKSPNPRLPGRVCEKAAEPVLLQNECIARDANDCDDSSRAFCVDLQQGYKCECKPGMQDVSPDPSNRPGRVCKHNINECANRTLNTCDPKAVCQDLSNGYTCQCPQGFLDLSPNPNEPGRMCSLLVNECLLKTHDCDPNALCEDTPESYRCQCPTGFLDISPSAAFPGRHCRQLIDECKLGIHDCDRNAICRDTEDSFVCSCPNGYVDRSPNKFTRPGRSCIKLVNECGENLADCSRNATCRDLESGFTCECNPGLIDRSPPTKPGRLCLPSDVCPPNDCGLNSVCIPQANGGFICKCQEGYLDKSPSSTPGRVCELGASCRDPKLNNCSRNAICYDLPNGYRCECLTGYADRSPNLPGRICESPTVPPTPRNPCLDRSLNDCHTFALCRSLSTTNFTCECAPGYADRSPDSRNKPGRVCVAESPVCADPKQNDCHPFAICTELKDNRKFSCSCRDGWIDKSTDASKPGRVCVEKRNECLDSSMNTCDRLAVCEDLDDGYNCRCPANFKDVSPDAKLPGRICNRQVNECENPQLNSCSRFAKCTDLENGYSCACLPGYTDKSANGTTGRECIPIINECLSANQNDCDQHADCEDLTVGYTCRCRPPYVDESVDRNRPGRRCRLNECLNVTFNQCDPNAVCQDTEDSYVCHCGEGFLDISPDPNTPGRRCTKAVTSPIAPTTPTTGIPCGSHLFCSPALREFCIGGFRCDCQGGQRRSTPRDICSDVFAITLPLWVMRRGQTPLIWSLSYADVSNPRFIEIAELFRQGIRNAIVNSPIKSVYVDNAVDDILNPRILNESWNQGLMFNYTVYVKPGSITPKNLWTEILKSIFATQYSVGGTELFINPIQPNIFLETVPDTCGNGLICNKQLEEVCIANTICGCAGSKRRTDKNSKCSDVSAYIFPLYVIRENQTPLNWASNLGNPRNPEYKRLLEIFSQGISNAYGNTSLQPFYVTNEVLDILDPKSINGTWGTGLLFNVSVFLLRDAVKDPQIVWDDLIRQIIATRYSVGGTSLFINGFQYNPYGLCIKNDCHPKAICYDFGYKYSCECPSGLVDRDGTRPGRKCTAVDGYNECADPKDNDCASNATCIDDRIGYHCECKNGFTDTSPESRGAGRVCEQDVCASVSSESCPANTTCRSISGHKDCACSQGYVEVLNSPVYPQLRVQGVSLCMATVEVNECALGLHNCSVVANCTDLIYGYQCQCLPGYKDGNPSLPGRLCAGASCGHCSNQGDCEIDESVPDKLKCRCHSWYAGKQCDKDIRMILVIIFAVIFLLLALACLLFFCLRCHCVKGRELWYREPLFTYRKGVWPWSTLEASSSSESGADFSGMSTSAFGGKGSDYYPDLAIPRAKLAEAGKGALKKQNVKSENKLMQYLGGNKMSNVRIPRAKVSAASSAEQLGSASVIFSDVHQGLPAGQSMKVRREEWSSGSGSNGSEYISSDSSSSGGYREEIERRVITDVTRTEYRKTVNADVHKNATAQFHVYPPGATAALTDATKTTTKTAEGANQRYSQNTIGSSTAEAMKDSQEFYDSFKYHNGSSVSGKPTSTAERDRGQSVIEVSVAGLHQGPTGSDWGGSQHYADTATTFSQPRAMSEYTERDLDDISEECSDATSASQDNDVYDKKVLVKKSHDFNPDRSGRGGTEKLRTEVSTKTVSVESKKK